MKHAITLSVCLMLGLLAPAVESAAQTAPPGPPGTVTLPLAEYDRLVDRANRPPAVPELPPLAAVARADLQLRASVTEVRAVITFQGEVLRRGRVKVPLVSGATLIDVQQAGSFVPVVHEAGTTSAVLDGPGMFTIAATVVSETTTEPGRATALLPAVRAGTVHATFEAIGENIDVRIDRGIAGPRASAGGKTLIDLTLEPGVPTRVWWSSREQAARTPRELRFVSDVKTLITVGETDLRLASLVDVSVLQGRAERLEIRLPSGFDVAGVSGSAIEIAAQSAGRLTLNLMEPDRHRYQFLLTLEKTTSPAERTDAAAHSDVPLPGLAGSQRETGEVAWESTRTVELIAAETGPLRRLDASEVSGSLAALARMPLLAALRYNRRGDDVVSAGFDLRRFENAPVLGAAADTATVTTLVTSEGRALTEFRMTLSNRGQTFLKVGIPAGATLLSALVGGEPVKPVAAPDGARVPLVRPGFRPAGAYEMSFVYLESGTAMGKKGAGEMKLPRVDVPIAALEWEVFLPDRYKVKRFEGDVIPRELAVENTSFGRGASTGVSLPPPAAGRLSSLRPDEVGGIVMDATGAVIPGATVTVRAGTFVRQAVTDEHGVFVVSGVPSRALTLEAKLQGFTTTVATMAANERAPVRLVLGVSGVAETVTVTAETLVVQSQSARRDQAQANARSSNVLNLQQLVSGILPVRIDLPRTGKSYMFVRPLVIDEETTLRFEYKQ